MRNILLALLLLANFIACKSAKEGTEKVVATLDTTFVPKLFVNGEGNLSGGDGAISIPLSENRSLFLWGDSFIGEVENNKRDTLSPLVVGNVFLAVDEKGVKTYCGGDTKHPTTWLLADSIDGHKTVLWPEHGFVKDGILHLFLANIVMSGSGTWDFYWHSLMYYRLSVHDFSVIDKKMITSDEVGGIHLGFACMQEGDNIYTYGTKTVDGRTALYLAKTKLVDNKLSDFSYFSNGKWTASPLEATMLSGNYTNVSEQFSVFKQGNKYILLTQERAGTNIYSYISDSMEGPWYNEKLLYVTPEPSENKNLITYNAMAHHQYTKNDSLLICYSVNTLDFSLLYDDVSVYRPRFLRVNLNDLMN